MVRLLAMIAILFVGLPVAAQPAAEPPKAEGSAPEAPEGLTLEFDIPYAATDNPRQRLDLYRPKAPSSDQPLPVVVVIHGAFQNPSKKSGLGFAVDLAGSGDYAVVAIGYRLSDEVKWPAQIHDCKAAIRWIRVNARKYNLDGDHIGVIGPSAGAHLASLLGTTGDVAALEGKLGEHLLYSSRVSCVVDLFGPTNLLTLGGNHDRANSPESRLIGGPLQERRELAQQASPMTHVTRNDPPFLIIHGTKDPNVPFDQAATFAAALETAGASATLVPVEGGLHGNFKTPEVQQRYRTFFDKYLRGKDVEVSSTAIQFKPQ
ncbi:MAG TPA: alpha/beta hydrolase [Schlesneria sp.]|jgi:acetyl esterase/lipase